VRSSFIYSPRFSRHSLGESHPFRPDRAHLLRELLDRQGWLDEPWMQVVEPDVRPLEAWADSVDPDFIAAIQRASRGEVDASLVEHGLGSEECPIFPGLDDYVALYCAATMTAVRLVLSDEADLVFNPLGGLHHSSRRVAEGFCYVNDVLIAIDSLLAAGHRVAYTTATGSRTPTCAIPGCSAPRCTRAARPSTPGAAPSRTAARAPAEG
jgi:acetoin utilization deacetylase AcuC-like enzyme